ncbi:GatB/YqeY domain-containing protein [Flaviaesturariibacter aridisoli]|uniref:GatB/YqeY domain-containing protein n=1 Tax=Flaviaesturariibacter aridisoli TaxID=2545761 RepID=A0A4V2WMS9_9BACT|nr:GatB/YqeY domain-containing protein [Flaviaesturariibacter aridisoli]TCZ72752.1 GatB/YqeY domain-containing protein [Flaviaesturariibacter aridisoli]
MALEQQIMDQMKEAMKSKNEPALRALRAIKAEIIKAKTEPGAGGVLPEDKEVALLQRMVKQRRDAHEIFAQQARADLAQKEQEEIDVIATFLPQQLSEEELKTELRAIIAQVGATSPADMGKVMGVASKQLAGRAEGKAISAAVKELLAAHP